MSPINPTYNGFSSFFEENRKKSDIKFSPQISMFHDTFNAALQVLRSSKGEQSDIAIVILLRAIKYLFTAHNLILDGHLEEARLMLRNVTELGLIAFLVGKNDDVYTLWKACRTLRSKKEKDGEVPLDEIKNEKFKFSEITKKNKTIIDQDQRATILFRLHNQLSEFVSHENLYSMIARIDTQEGETSVYVGQSSDSQNDRMLNELEFVNQLISILKDLKSEFE